MDLKELTTKFNLFKDTFVVFDVETTGLSPKNDCLIEIGAVKICEGKIVDSFNELIDPEISIPLKITEITHITNEMVKGKPKTCEVVKRFLKWTDNLPVIAHNARFDVSFIKVACYKYHLGMFKNEVIDTMLMARTLHPEWINHKLDSLTTNLEVLWNEEEHHRALYDAKGTALSFYKMCEEIEVKIGS